MKRRERTDWVNVAIFVLLIICPLVFIAWVLIDLYQHKGN